MRAAECGLYYNVVFLLNELLFGSEDALAALALGIHDKLGQFLRRDFRSLLHRRRDFGSLCFLVGGDAVILGSRAVFDELALHVLHLSHVELSDVKIKVLGEQGHYKVNHVGHGFLGRVALVDRGVFHVHYHPAEVLLAQL